MNRTEICLLSEKKDPLKNEPAAESRYLGKEMGADWSSPGLS